MTLESILGGLQELDGILNGLVLSGAVNGDHNILDWVQSEVQFLNEFFVEDDQLISFAGAIKAALFHIGDQAVRQLMPHLGNVIGFQLINLVLELWELGRMLIEKSIHFGGTKVRH
jgi:hypothetical protein